MELETKRLKITPCTNEWMPLLQQQNYDNGPEIANHILSLIEDPALLFWGSWLVIRESDGAIVGDIGFKGKPNAQKEVEIGYGLLDQYCGKGYATEAVEALIDWALNTEEVGAVLAETEPDNMESIRVMEKVQMKRTKESESTVFWIKCENK